MAFPPVSVAVAYENEDLGNPASESLTVGRCYLLVCIQKMGHRYRSASRYVVKLTSAFGRTCLPCLKASAFISDFLLSVISRGGSVHL